MAPPKTMIRGFVGVGHEADGAYGTAVARTAFARVLDSSVDEKHGTVVPPTSRQPAGEDAVLGNYDVNVNARMELRAETVGSFLKAHAGLASSSSEQPDAGGNPTVRRWTILPQDTRQPETFERRLGTLTKSQLVDGVVLEEFGLEWSNDLVVNTVKGPGRKTTLLDPPTTPTFDATKPLSKHMVAITVAGASFPVKSGRVTLGRKVDKADYVSGSRYRVDAEITDIMARLEFELSLRDAAVLQRSWGATNATAPQDDPLYTAMNVKVTGANISGVYNRELELDFPRTHWEIVPVMGRGKDPIAQRVVAQVLYDESSTYAWKGTLTNTQTTI